MRDFEAIPWTADVPADLTAPGASIAELSRALAAARSGPKAKHSPDWAPAVTTRRGAERGPRAKLAGILIRPIAGRLHPVGADVLRDDVVAKLAGENCLVGVFEDGEDGLQDVGVHR